MSACLAMRDATVKSESTMVSLMDTYMYMYMYCQSGVHVHVSNVYVYTPTAGVCDLPINRIDSLCKNEGKCINTGVLEYRCECLPGYEGRYCEIRVNYGQFNGHVQVYMDKLYNVHLYVHACTCTCISMYMYIVCIAVCM